MKKPTLTIPKRNSHDPRWNELGKYIKYLKDSMGLLQWHFLLSHTSPKEADQDDEEVLASIDIVSQSVSATIYVSDTFWTQEPWRQRWILVHELLHVVEAAYIKAIEAGYEATRTARMLINQLRERFIDQVALMLAPRYSLPPAGFKKKVAPKPKKKVGHVPHIVTPTVRGGCDL